MMGDMHGPKYPAVMINAMLYIKDQIHKDKQDKPVNERMIDETDNLI